MTPLLLIVGTMLLAQPAGEPVEELHFLAPAVNLGELRSHVVREHRFEFVNQGSHALEIVGIDPSCGCMVASLPARRIQPGAQGSLVVRVKPSSQPQGSHTWFAKVRYLSQGREQAAHVQIQATIRHEVSVTPGVLAWNGANGFQRELTVSDLRDHPLNVKLVEATSPILKATVVGTEKGVTRILVQTTGEIPPGRHDEMVNIYTDDALYQHLQVPVTLTGQVRRTVSFSPEVVSPRRTAGQPIPATLVQLRSTNDRPIAIAGVTSDDPAIICTWAHGPLNGATLRIRIDEAKVGERSLESSVSIRLTEPAEVIVIPVRVR